LLSRSVILDVSWADCWFVVDVMFAKPKSSALACGSLLTACGFPFVPNSTKPSRFVGTTMSFFGSRTTPRFWSSRTSIILFFFLKNMVMGGYEGIKRFVGNV